MKANNSIKVAFNYELYNGGRPVCCDQVMVIINESAIEEAAEYVKTNGGHMVDLVALTGIEEAVFEELFTSVLVEKLPDSESYDNVQFIIQEKVPDELAIAIDEYIQTRSVRIRYYAQTVEANIEEYVTVDVSKESFRKMVEAVYVTDRGDSKSDFAFLKRFAPKAYDEIYALISSGASEHCKRRYGYEVTPVMREFPLEVYDYV